MFRNLRADEIDCRISTITEKGLSLLLYKDARCDMNILDETVGAENWTRSHELINGNLYCNVGIRFTRNKGENNEYNEWVFKQDVGTESNTEKEKGQASDSFKRACFNWGIGRELYTAPFIWISSSDCEIKKKQNGKLACNNKFVATELEVLNGKITKLTVVNQTLKKVVFSFGTPKKEPKQADKKIIEEIEDIAEELNVAIFKLEKKYKVKVLSELTQEQAENCLAGLKGMKNG